MIRAQFYRKAVVHQPGSCGRCSAHKQQISAQTPVLHFHLEKRLHGHKNLRCCCDCTSVACSKVCIQNAQTGDVLLHATYTSFVGRKHVWGGFHHNKNPFWKSPMAKSVEILPAPHMPQWIGLRNNCDCTVCIAIFLALQWQSIPTRGLKVCYQLGPKLLMIFKPILKLPILLRTH